MQLDGGDPYQSATDLGLIKTLPRRIYGERSIQGELLPGEAVDWFRFRVGRKMRSGNLQFEVDAEVTQSSTVIGSIPISYDGSVLDLWKFLNRKSKFIAVDK